MSDDVAIAILAAGRGSRFGGDGPKCLEEWQGRPLVTWALDAAVASGLHPVLLVTGFERRRVDAAAPAGVDIVHNRHWRDGIASSLRTALAMLDGYARVDAVCIGLADQPRIGAEAYRRLAAAYEQGAQLAVATYDGTRGNPVLLARSLWDEADELTGDVGARVLMQRHPVVEVACADTGSAIDVDTPADLKNLDVQEHPVKIEDQFHVTVPVDEAWKVLLDVERIAPCMPGAQLQEIEGDEFRGIVKVKVGPITAQYKGAARIESADEATHTVVIKAEGRDTRGQGNASATVTAVLEPEGTGTVVKIDTDLNVTGKVAQFGRGVMADVSSKLLGQFAECLQTTHLSGAPAAPGAEESAAAEPATASVSPGDTAATDATDATRDAAATSGVRTINSPDPEPVDLLDASSDAVIKRVVPIVAALVVLLAIRSMFKRRSRRRND